MRSHSLQNRTILVLRRGEEMNSDEQKSWLMSIEEAVVDATEASGLHAVDEVFAMHGARGIDDLSGDSYEQVFSELVRLASG